MDIRVKLISVFSNRELLVIVNGDVDLTRADGFIFGVVELSDVWVLEGLLGSQSFVWVELEEALEKVNCIITSCGEHVSETLALCWRKRLKHGLCKWTVDSINVFG